MSTSTRRSRFAALVAAAVGLLVTAGAPEARVTKISITGTTSAFDGRVFDGIGAYEQVRGTASGELNPLDRRNAVITDIHLAPRNASGKVEYTTTFTLLKPVDMSRASGVLVYGISNRGGRALGFGNIGVTATNPAGDGFDQRTGNVYLASGWQGDLVFAPATAAETIDVPVARNPDGSSVTGPTFARFVAVAGTSTRGRCPGEAAHPPA